jgi:hypothetical protein
MGTKAITTHSLPRAAVLATALFACGCLGGAPSPGMVQLALTGAGSYTPDHVQPERASHVVSAFVKIDEIDARVGIGWIPLTTTPVTIDLLALDQQKLTTLGIGKLPSGHVRALRLVLDEVGDYVVLADGRHKPLEVPDNGVVIVKGDLDLDSCAAGILILDFDPRIIVEQCDDFREYELLSTASIRTEEVSGSCQPGVDGGGNDGGGKDGGGGVQCGNQVCDPNTQICFNGQCMTNPCLNKICNPPTTCHVDPATGLGVCQ